MIKGLHDDILAGRVIAGGQEGRVEPVIEAVLRLAELRRISDMVGTLVGE